MLDGEITAPAGMMVVKVKELNNELLAQQLTRHENSSASSSLYRCTMGLATRTHAPCARYVIGILHRPSKRKSRGSAHVMFANWIFRGGVGEAKSGHARAPPPELTSVEYSRRLSPVLGT